MTRTRSQTKSRWIVQEVDCIYGDFVPKGLAERGYDSEAEAFRRAATMSLRHRDKTYVVSRYEECADTGELQHCDTVEYVSAQ